MPFADRKTWENTRPSDIKDRGIGAACDLWKKKLPGKKMNCRPRDNIGRADGESAKRKSDVSTNMRATL
jgi:hypothetical protein